MSASKGPGHRCGPGGPALLVEDTNVALASADTTHPQHPAGLRRVERMSMRPAF